MSDSSEPVTKSAPKLSLGRLLPLLVLVAGLGAFFALGLNEYVTLDTLRDNRELLNNWVIENALTAAIVYILAYAVMVSFSLPGALIATLTGGFLFGTWVGGLYTVTAATIGATILFIAARTALGEYLESKAGPAIRKMEKGFQDNAFSYLLVLRLVPIFPFFLVNLAPAFLGVSLRTYVVATFVGIIPGTFVYASVGNGLGALFDRGEDPNLGIIFDPQILGPLIGLAVLAMIPVAYKRFTGRKAASKD